MKKFLSLALALVLALALAVPSYAAEPEAETVGVIVNGERISFSGAAPELRSGQTRARGLIAVNLIQDDRAVRLDADRAARAGRGRAVNTGGGDRAVIDQQLAADRVIHVRPVAVVCIDRQRNLFPDRKVHPGGNVCAV